MTVPSVLHARSQSVQAQPQYEASPRSGMWYIGLASAADTITPWGLYPAQRDMELRAFWPTEPILAGAVSTICARNATQNVVFDGPEYTVEAVKAMWNEADFGGGSHSLLMKISEDLYTQDNGAFIEVIRSGIRPDAAVVGIAHLDARQCRRTGIADYPVVYVDPHNGSHHRMGWWQVVTLEEMPSPIKTMNGMQYCALTRILRAAQLARDINIYELEKISGRNPSSLHMVGGVQQTLIDQAMERGQEKGDNQGSLRYVLPVILASLDPTAEVSHVEIPLKGLPDGFDKAENFKQYIAIMALGFLEDYQTFAPLPGGNLGTSTQSEVLSLKARGKGSGLFAKMLLHALMYKGIIPQSVEAEIEDRDIRAEGEEADVAATRASTRAARVASGEISAAIARQIARDEGDLEEEYLVALGEEDAISSDVTMREDEQVQEAGDMDEETAGAKQPVPPQLRAYQKKERRDVSMALEAVHDAIRTVKGMPFDATPVAAPSAPVHIHLQDSIVLKQAPPNVVVNVPQQPAPSVNVAPAMVHVSMPQQPAPTVNVAAPAVSVNVPQQAAPVMTVNVPEQKAPIVNVSVPQATEETLVVERNSDGLIASIRKTITRKKAQ